MNIVFIVVCAFPTGEASSIRALNLTRLLAECGHNVHVISDVAGEVCDNVPCTFESISSRQDNVKARYYNAISSVDHLKRYCSNHSVDVVLMNARSDRYNSVQKFCAEKGIKLLVESCEWYHFGNFKLKFLDPRFLQNELMILHGFKKADGFISISRYLDNYNKSLGKPSVRIPTIMDVMTVPEGEGSHKDRIQIVYTGNPGNSKEYLAPMINILAEHESLRSAVQFHIYGPNQKQVLRNKGVTQEALTKAKDSVVIHGRIPQLEIQRVLMNADYQLFLRPNRKSSNAGFPTKLAESMAVGTPVITNDTGDIGLYVTDHKNGFLLSNLEEEELIKCIKNCIAQTQEEKVRMRRSARYTAEQSFDYHEYVTKTKKLFEGIK